MGFKEIIERLRGKSEDKDSLKEYISDLDKRTRAEEIVMNRRKSADERELERDFKEEREKEIKRQLEIMRKRRQDDINFGHNPLNTKFIMGKSEWEILKEKNLFNSQGNIFSNQENIFVPKRRKR